MTEFAGRIAVVTGGGSGMGRELVRQLVAEACNVAMCDFSPTGLVETQRLCEAAGLPQGLRVTTHIADVAVWGSGIHDHAFKERLDSILWDGPRLIIFRERLAKSIFNNSDHSAEDCYRSLAKIPHGKGDLITFSGSTITTSERKTLVAEISAELLPFLIGQNFSLISNRIGGNPTVFSGLSGNNQAGGNSEKTKESKNCPYSCDPIEAFGGPKLSHPEIAFGALVLFLATMYFSDKGLERRPFGAQHVGCWLVAVVSGCLFVVSALPIVLRIVWPLI